MTFLIVLGSIIAFFLLISLLRIGVSAEYSDEGLMAWAHAGPLRITLYPKEEKAEKKEKEKKPKKKEEKPQPGVFSQLKSMLPDIKKALSRLKRKLLIKELTIYYLSAGATDPAQAALTFGGISAGYGLIIPILENNFRIKKRDLRANVDFDAEEPYIYVKAKLSLAVWEAVYIGFGLVMSMAKARNPGTTIRKAV